MKIECGIVADLLPLYIDGACNPESVKMIEEHLSECVECTRRLQEMRQVQPTETIAADSRKILRRHRRRGWNRVIAGVLAGILLAAGTFVLTMRFVGPSIDKFIARGTASYAVVTIGPSDDYSQEDIEAAMRVVQRQFWRYERCVLMTLIYNQRWSREWGATMPGYDDVIVLKGSFFLGSGGLNGMSAGEIREGWSWYLARSAGSGKWTVIGQGYA